MKKSYFSLLIVGCLSTTIIGCVQHPQQDLSAIAKPKILPVTKVVVGQNVPEKFEQVIVPDIYQGLDESKTQIIRQGRYTLVNASPEEGQKYLLEQMVTVNMKPKRKGVNVTTVEQGLKTTLLGTGLHLCIGSSLNKTATLYSLPLPKIHQQFGPIKLREALQMLAGTAYYVTLNDITRTVCFKPRETPINIEQKRIEIISTTTETEVINE